MNLRKRRRKLQQAIDRKSPKVEKRMTPEEIAKEYSRQELQTVLVRVLRHDQRRSQNG